MRACVRALDGARGTDGRTDRLLGQVPTALSYLVLDAGVGYGDWHLGGSLLAPARPIFSNKRHYAESAS